MRSIKQDDITKIFVTVEISDAEYLAIREKTSIESFRELENELRKKSQQYIKDLINEKIRTRG